MKDIKCGETFADKYLSTICEIGQRYYTIQTWHRLVVKICLQYCQLPVYMANIQDSYGGSLRTAGLCKVCGPQNRNTGAAISNKLKGKANGCA